MNSLVTELFVNQPKNSQIHIDWTIPSDVLTGLVDFCTDFYRSSITSIEATQFVKTKICKLRSQYLEKEIQWSETAMHCCQRLAMRTQIEFICVRNLRFIKWQWQAAFIRNIFGRRILRLDSI